MIRPDHISRLDLDEDAERPALIGIHLLPSAATLGNLVCGFLAIYCCILSIRVAYFADTPLELAAPKLLSFFAPTWIAAGSVLIVLAMVFDALDGRLARITRKTSEFGSQLDSIADIVSFGAAPPLLLLTALLPLAMPGEAAAPPAIRLQWRASMVCGLVYVSCAAIRLARYNAENIRGESAQKTFSGLPVPGAAAAFVALLVLYEDLKPPAEALLGVDWSMVLRWLIPPAVFGLGLLMVSRMDYLHVVNIYVRRKQPPMHLIWLLVAAGIGWYSPQVLLVVIAGAYVLSGPILGARMARAKRVAATPLAKVKGPPVDVN